MIIIKENNMKNVYSYLLSSLPKKIIASTFVFMAVLLPISSISAAAVKLESSIGVANVTKGDTQYAHSINAKYDQVVKFQVFYHNTEDENSGKIAENVKMKIAIPNQTGGTQTIRSTVGGTNTNTVESTATVNLEESDASLEYIPGSAVWRHNVGTNANVDYQETVISDAVVTSGQGIVLEDEKPCYNFAATVTVLARVKVPGITVDKQVRVKGSTTWTTENTAKPGETLEYMITYKNMGNTEQKNVVIRDNLPPKLSYVNGTTYLKNTTNPNGVLYNSDNIDKGGIVVGNYTPGAAAYVKFDVKIPEESQLECGDTVFRNVGVVKPEGMNEFYNTATTTVNKVCNDQPVYSCDALNVETFDGRRIKATVKYTAKNGATFKSATYNFGDSSTELVTDKTTVEHTYAQDGQYTIRATLTFMVNGQAQVATSGACVQSVNFSSNKPVPPTPNHPTPSVIPNTGPGEAVAGIFVATTITGAIGYRLWAARRLDR